MVVDLNPLWGQSKWWGWGMCKSIRCAWVEAKWWWHLQCIGAQGQPWVEIFPQWISFPIWDDLKADWWRWPSPPPVSCHVSAADIAMNILSPLIICHTWWYHKHCPWALCHWRSLSVIYELSMVARAHFWEPECLGLNPGFETMAVWLWLNHWPPGI